MTEISIYPAGTCASLNLAAMTPTISCTILAAQVRGADVSYEIAYWKDQERKTVWVADHELTGHDELPNSIGFKTPKPGGGLNSGR